MKAAKIILAVAASIMLPACVSEKTKTSKGAKKTVSVNTADFNKISITGSFSVHFTQGNATTVKMSGREKDLEEMEIKSNGEKLSICTKSQKKLKLNIFSFARTGGVDIYITSPNLRGVEITGSGNFTTEGQIDTDNMGIGISGSGDVEMKNLICNGIYAEITGSGNIDINRITTAKAKLSIAGSGNISMDKADIGHAESSIAGSGSISLKGNIKSHHDDVASSGSVKIN